MECSGIPVRFILLLGARVTATLGLPQPVRREHPYTVGLMFWFRRNKFVGSYVFFSVTNRSYFPP